MMKTTTVGFVLIVSMIAGFMLNTTIFAGGASDNLPTASDPAQIFDRVEDAEAEAGFKLSSPRLIPPGFERGKTFVMQLGTAGGEKSVLQSWNRSSDGAFIFLEESPVLKGINGGGESVYLNGKPAIRRESPPLKGRPYGLYSFFWAEEDRGIVLVGSLLGGLLREDIKSVAESADRR